MSTHTLAPRDYQLNAIRALHEKWDAGMTRVATVLPTGAGKTVVFSHLADRFLTENPGQRVLVLSHTDELVGQAADKMRRVAPGRSVGIVKAGQNEVHAEIISASVQTLRSARRREQITRVGLVIVDECHHATAKTYRDILEHFGCLPSACDSCRGTGYSGDGATPGGQCWDCQATGQYNGGQTSARAAGFTATLVRGDKAKLSDVWEDVAFKLSIAFMIRAGYLLDVKGKRVEVPDLHLERVKQSGGDYQEGALGDALVEAMAPEIVAKAYTEHAADRKGIVFAPTVDSAYAFQSAFLAAGFTCEVVHGKLGREERRAILRRLKSGETQVVANCMVLTEGFDEPTVSCAVIARPTKSSGLYQQMVGRVLRPDLTLAPADRGHALILDVVGVSRRHDLRSLVDLSTRDDLSGADLDEDLSLLALEDLILDEPEPEQESTGGTPEADWYVGPAETREFDPLGRDSDRAWGQTPGGTYYLTAGSDGYVFISDAATPEPGLYDVVWCAKTVARGQHYAAARFTEHRNLDLPMALAYGEEQAIELGGHGSKTLTGKKSAWRREPATAGALHKANRMGQFLNVRWVEAPEDPFAHPPVPAGTRHPVYPDGSIVTKGEVSQVIDAGIAASVIDPLVQFVKQRHTPTEE